LFQSEEFGISARTTATIIFICPYGTPVEKVRFAVRRLVRAGYHVVAYETTAAVFTDADPAILPELIAAVRQDIGSRIAKLTAAGVTEFGFFGSSLGSFILYNCVGHRVPELRWGVFNTGGNIARGVWGMPELRQSHVARGWSLPGQHRPAGRHRGLPRADAPGRRRGHRARGAGRQPPHHRHRRPLEGPATRPDSKDGSYRKRGE
jgi:hypothetical protein